MSCFKKGDKFRSTTQKEAFLEGRRKNADFGKTGYAGASVFLARECAR